MAHPTLSNNAKDAPIMQDVMVKAAFSIMLVQNVTEI
jgi:hypothetical protein